MASEYDVCLGAEKIGTAQVQREGLYYRIRCMCRLTGEVPYRIEVSAGDDRIDLGLCVPMEGCFGLVTRIPVKRLGEGIPVFQALPRHQKAGGRFIPIRAEEPFAYLSRLKDAYLARAGAQVGIMIEDQKEISKPTGQWSEPKISE